MPFCGFHNTMAVSFSGKKALVTGAGRGLGRAVAQALAERGAKVFALSRTEANLEKLKTEIPTIDIICIDLTDWKATREAVSNIGPVDLLVNAAGVLQFSTLLETTEDEIDNMFTVNIKASINVSQVVGKNMIEAGMGGAIVNLSSVSGSRHSEEMGIYCITKTAIEMLTKTMAREFGPHGIRVNSVAPGITMTDMGKQFPPERLERYKQLSALKKLPEIEECVNMILFLLSDKSSGTTGSNMAIDCGILA